MDTNNGLILVADDDQVNLKMMTTMLKKMGFDVITADNGKKVLECIEVNTPDMLLLDIHMPVIDGCEACRRIKNNESWKDIPIVFFSALNDDFNKVEAFKLGAVDYITKPFSIDETRARLASHFKVHHEKKQLKAFNESMVNREMRVIELKAEVNLLSSELGRKAPYPSAAQS